MKTYYYPSSAAAARLERIAGRGVAFSPRDVRDVVRILAQVRKEKDRALVRYVNQFDAPSLKTGNLRVTDEEMERALAQVDPGFMGAMERAAARIREFHRRQLPNSWITVERAGAVLGQITRPVDAAGVYVPGGRSGNTPLVSSVLMGCIPAKIAGVSRIQIATPPRQDGTVHPYLLAAARHVGVDAVFKVGSAWGIGALAYGTETVPRVDVIVGPGNVFVTIAKKLVAGTVGTDMVAGPSEVLVLGDAAADSDHVAADLLSQAEHDPLSLSIFVTTEKRLARKVRAALESRVRVLSREQIARAALEKHGAIFVVPDLDTAVDLANRIAPEHLELLVAEPFAWVGKIRNAGAVFLGPYSPEPVGDFVAGPNHILPTAGTARYASALSVETFVKKTSLIHYTRQTLQEDAQDIILLAETEGLGAHAASVKARLSRHSHTP